MDDITMRVADKMVTTVYIEWTTAPTLVGLLEVGRQAQRQRKALGPQHTEQQLQYLIDYEEQRRSEFARLLRPHLGATNADMIWRNAMHLAEDDDTTPGIALLSRSVDFLNENELNDDGWYPTNEEDEYVLADLGLEVDE